jgi:hypothetical protein
MYSISNNALFSSSFQEVVPNLYLGPYGAAMRSKVMAGFLIASSLPGGISRTVNQSKSASWPCAGLCQGKGKGQGTVLGRKGHFQRSKGKL